jgi:hypothetical protein
MELLESSPVAAVAAAVADSLVPVFLIKARQELLALPRAVLGKARAVATVPEQAVAVEAN